VHAVKSRPCIILKLARCGEIGISSWVTLAGSTHWTWRCIFFAHLGGLYTFPVSWVVSFPFSEKKKSSCGPVPGFLWLLLLCFWIFCNLTLTLYSFVKLSWLEWIILLRKLSNLANYSMLQPYLLWFMFGCWDQRGNENWSSMLS
jgi:hypothetical protein